MEKLKIIKLHLIKIIDQIKEYAISCAKKSKVDKENDFLWGITFGASTAISTMQNLFSVLQDIKIQPILKEMHLNDINPEGDLLLS